MRLIKISQQLASIQSNEKEIFIYNDNGLDKIFIDYNEMKIKIKKIITPKSDTTNYNDQLFSLIKLLKNRIENENDEEILLISLSHILFLIEKYSECKIENSKKENKK
jgi:hypothetical protein